MKKELFVTSIIALKKQYEADGEFVLNMGKAFPNADSVNLLPENHLVVNQLILILQELMNDIKPVKDGCTWIEYFINNLNFGENYKPGCLIIDEQEIDISTPKKLYDFLISLNS